MSEDPVPAASQPAPANQAVLVRVLTEAQQSMREARSQMCRLQEENGRLQERLAASAQALTRSRQQNEALTAVNDDLRAQLEGAKAALVSKTYEQEETAASLTKVESCYNEAELLAAELERETKQLNEARRPLADAGDDQMTTGG